MVVKIKLKKDRIRINIGDTGQKGRKKQKIKMGVSKNGYIFWKMTSDSIRLV